MGIYSGKTPQPEDQAPLLGCAFNVGNFWLRFVGIFHTMHQRAEKLRIIIPTLGSTCAAVRALLCFLHFKHHPCILLLEVPSSADSARDASEFTELSIQGKTVIF